MKNGLPILKKIYISFATCVESESEKMNVESESEKYFFGSATLDSQVRLNFHLNIEEVYAVPVPYCRGLLYENCSVVEPVPMK
jgi:hypothetical protein